MSDANAAIIQVMDLSLGFAGQTLLQNINFQVQPGEIFVILGPSGSGKSVLLKHLIGLYSPWSGQVLIQGQDLHQAQTAKRFQILQKIGVSFQTGALFGSMNLGQNVALPLQELTPLPQRAIERIVHMKLHLVGLSGYGHLMPAELSGGMQKRAAIARAMALDPLILFLDEPSAGLDPLTSADLDGLIRNLSSFLGITFVIVSHELQSIFSVAQRMIILDSKQKGIAAQGAPQELLASPPTEWVRRFLHRDPAPSP
ncbi:MAG: ATP-binding cassette domain-containing protein [Desulfohalobiaceae bacterium]